MNRSDDVEYRLDADHIRSVCQAARPEETPHLTHVDRPPHVTVHVEFPYHTAEVLNRVGYRTELPRDRDTWNGRDSLMITGWSTPQLGARAAALAGMLERFRGGLADVAARAIDLYALNSQGDHPDITRSAAVRGAVGLLQREIELITGPHAIHDPHIRPRDDTQARLLADNQRLERAIADHIREASRVAGYAVTAYTNDPKARTQPVEARPRAITSAIGRHSADIRSAYAQRRTASPGAPGPADTDHPAAVAASDQPATAGPTRSPGSPDAVADTAGTPPPPTPPRGRRP